MNKISDFFVEWFWWRWRSKWLNKQTDKDRRFIGGVLSEYSASNYLYLGFGSTLRHLRDGNLLKQDMDILISNEFYKSADFNKMINELGAKKWHDGFYEGKLIYTKFLVNNRTPLEFFINYDKEMETTLHIHDGFVWRRQIPLQKISIYETNYGPQPMPTDLKEYVVSIYGEKWNEKITTRKYDFKVDSNLSTLKNIGNIE